MPQSPDMPSFSLAASSGVDGDSVLKSKQAQCHDAWHAEVLAFLSWKLFHKTEIFLLFASSTPQESSPQQGNQERGRGIVLLSTGSLEPTPFLPATKDTVLS